MFELAMTFHYCIENAADVVQNMSNAWSGS